MNAKLNACWACENQHVESFCMYVYCAFGKLYIGKSSLFYVCQFVVLFMGFFVIMRNKLLLNFVCYPSHTSSVVDLFYQDGSSYIPFCKSRAVSHLVRPVFEFGLLYRKKVTFHCLFHPCNRRLSTMSHDEVTLMLQSIQDLYGFTIVFNK